MDKKFKQQLFLVAFGIILFAALMNLGAVMKFLGKGIDIIFPILVGFLIAFVLNVPMNGFENLFDKITKKTKKKPKKKRIRFLSVLSTYLSILLFIILIVTLVIPALVSSVTNIYNLVVDKFPIWVEYLKQYDIDTEQLIKWFETFDLKSFIKNISIGAGSMLSVAAKFVSNIFSGFATFSIALIISIYALLYKDELLRQCDKLASSFINEKVYKYTKHIIDLLNKTYANFLSGQCLEACILGILMFVVLSIFRIPYAGLIGVLAAVTSFIPYIGATFACILGTFLVLITEPQKAVLCLIVYLVTQYIENQFIYPHVVGTSVGLSPLWTLVAVLIGGEMFGLFGMIFFIPLMAVIFQLLREYTTRRCIRKS